MAAATDIWTLGPESNFALTSSLLLTSFVLSSIIGFERQLRQKQAGLRTLILVGTGSGLFTIVSGYGFGTLLGSDVVLDPSRIAAQIASGIGFLGAGVIFTRKNFVRGLTTAASIWVTAAVGMAAGAGLPWIAIEGTILYLIATTVLMPIVTRLPGASDRNVLRLTYIDGHGILRDILSEATSMGYTAQIESTERIGDKVVLRARFRGRPPLRSLVATLTELSGVVSVRISQDTEGGPNDED
ncbi:MgtC/SapB family protein [Kocuria sp. TGY1127_2]|uniref:MgtC/SapB family protein n=1 Tax=Kocuria sp. TGY1127_2 TaxID=2711328 RepID=UPI0015BFDBC2|nr:MgtC/SapB family protein [Kocuria sp. TGY1127_2]